MQIFNDFWEPVRSPRYSGFWLAIGHAWYVMDDFGTLVPVNMFTFSEWVNER